jgi:S1-C subfamily serine protease
MPNHLGRLWAAALLMLALAGCSGNDTQALEQATNAPAPPRAAAPAGGTTAVADQGAARPVVQQVTPIPEDVQQRLDAEELVVANVFDRVGPAVVKIETGQGLGSGFLIDKDGHIVTNNHVIAGSQNGQVLVSFSGLFQTVGKVVGADSDSDIAVVKVDELPEGVTPVELGDSEKARVGQRTIAIGNPLGQDRTVTTGIVSAVGREIREDEQGQGVASYTIGGALQTDAAINPGNSGGPLLDSRGRVLGMNTAILSQSGTSSGIGFAVPVNLIKKVAPALIEQGHYDHPWLGVSLGDVTTYEAKRNNLPSAGVMIAPDPNTGRDSPALKAGLADQSILTAINGTPATSANQVIAFLELNTQAGDTVTLTLINANGQRRELQVKLGARPRVEDRPQAQP